MKINQYSTINQCGMRDERVWGMGLNAQMTGHMESAFIFGHTLMN